MYVPCRPVAVMIVTGPSKGQILFSQAYIHHTASATVMPVNGSWQGTEAV